jgi:hypothetical protein
LQFDGSLDKVAGSMLGRLGHEAGAVWQRWKQKNKPKEKSKTEDLLRAKAQPAWRSLDLNLLLDDLFGVIFLPWFETHARGSG